MNIFITGITGTLGKRVAKLCLQDGHRVFGLSRCELKLKQTEAELVGSKIFLGDIKNYNSLEDIFYKIDTEIKLGGIDILFHFAALKHIEICETYVEECNRTNIDGTKNILKIQNKYNIPRLIFTSTDKAVMPINVYGASKLIGERMVINNHDRNIVCRYGNVLNSRGSVFGIFKDQLLKTGKANITHREMTRFFIKIDDAANYVYSLIDLNPGEKERYRIPWGHMKTCYVRTLAEAMNFALTGKSYTSFIDIGLRSGEKIHEDMGIKDGKNQTSFIYERYTLEELVDLAKGELDER